MRLHTIEAFVSDARLHTVGYALLTVLLIVPCLGAASRLRGQLVLPRTMLFALVLVLLGFAAELIFFLSMVNTAGAVVVAWAAALYGAWETLRLARDAGARRSLMLADSWMPFAMTGAAAAGYIAFLCMSIPGHGSLLTSLDSWLSLPVDNQLPYILASHILNHMPPKPFFGEWLSSDRPPLQSGFDLLFSALLPFGHHSEPRFQAVSMLMQASSIGMLYTLCRLCGCRPLRSVAVAVLASCSGFFFLNTLFVWPKLIAAAYLAVSLSMFLVPGTLTWRRGIVVGISTALGVLCHGGVIFSIPVLALTWLIAKRENVIRPFVAAAASAFILLAPWTWYQNFYDPPGTRLLKWHLAGQIPVTSEGFAQTFYRAYTDRPLATIVGYKLDNFATPLGLESTVIAPTRRKDREFFFVRDALSGLFVPYLAALVFFRSRRRTLRTASRLAWFAAGSTVFWCLAIYLPGTTVVHVGSYFTMLLMFVAGGIVATEWLPIFLPVTVWQVYDFSTAWLPIVGGRNLATPGGVCGVTILLALSATGVAILRKDVIRGLPLLRPSVLRDTFRQYRKINGAGIGTVLGVALLVIPIAIEAQQHITVAIPDVAAAVAATPAVSDTKTSFAVNRLATLRRLRGFAPLSLDAVSIGGQPYNVAALTKPQIFQVKSNESVNLDGWAFDPAARRPAAGVAIALNGRAISAKYGGLRADVAKVYAQPVLTDVGFSARLTGRDLARGLSVVSIIIIASDGRGYYLVPTRVHFQKQ